MPSKLVRVVLDLTSNNFTVEYGERRAASLTFVQADEREKLIEDLKEFTEFATAEKIEDEERRGLVEKKRRLEELNEMEDMEHVEWYPLEEHLIGSLLIVAQPGMLHTYVENLPNNLLDKILQPQITLNFGAGGAGGITPETEARPIPPPVPVDDPAGLEGRTPNELAVIGVMLPGTPQWYDYVDVEEKDGIVHVTPKKFLGDDWGPINRPLKAVYGQKVWISKGKGDITAHWQCEVK